MATANLKPPKFKEKTHEGAPASRTTTEQALRRSVMSCLLWEDEFYENGVAIADRISQLASSLPPAKIAEIAIEAREVAKLRHVPLLLLVTLCKVGAGSSIVSETIARVVSRADELTELVALYWKLNPKRANGKNATVSGQLKKGLALAFNKFDAYQLGKYNRDNAVKLRDVLFLSHTKPQTDAHIAIYKALTDKTLVAPDTWEVALSDGADKGETFTRLLKEGKLGYLALLRNLRNMEQSGVDRTLVVDALAARKGAHNVLPFRYIAAAHAAPSFEPALDKALIASVDQSDVKLPGRTFTLVDVSGSMSAKLSGKSDLMRIDAAATLAAVLPSEDHRVFSFSNRLVEVPARKGMAGVESIRRSQPNGGTDLGGAVKLVNTLMRPEDRLIVITDEQSNSVVPAPIAEKAYMINVASYKNGVGYNQGWTKIDGFSENVLRFIYETEALQD